MAKRAWLSLIWVIKPENTGALFAIQDFIGVCLITMLPVGLVKLREIQMGVPRCEMCTTIFVLIEGTLHAPATAHPPLGMRATLISNGALIMGMRFCTFSSRKSGPGQDGYHDGAGV
jgi:hypothetical protein